MVYYILKSALLLTLLYGGFTVCLSRETFHRFNSAVLVAIMLVSLALPAVRAVHEYEADEAVILQGIDAKQYQLLLAKKAVDNRLQPFANTLNRGSLKHQHFTDSELRQWAKAEKAKDTAFDKLYDAMAPNHMDCADVHRQWHIVKAVYDRK